MNCCNHNCEQGRDCPDRALVTPEDAESWVLRTVVSVLFFVIAGVVAVRVFGAHLSFPFN